MHLKTNVYGNNLFLIILDQRMQVIAIYNDLNDLGVRNKCKKVSEIA